MTMQVKTSELVPLNQRLIPAPLALAFGIAVEDNLDSERRNDAHAQPSPCKAVVHQRKVSPQRQRQQDADNTYGTQSAADPPLLPKAAEVPSFEEPAAVQPIKHAAAQQRHSQPDASMAQGGSMLAVSEPQAVAASMQPNSAAAAACASMQATPSLSAGYPHHQHHGVHLAHHAAHAAHAATANAAVMHASLRGFPAAYGFSPHAASLMPYMAPAPQVSVSNLTGSLGCPPMSVYSAPADYSQMVRGQDEPLDDNQARALKRPRLVWTPQLHSLFEEAVQKLGLEKAVPKTIMQMMNVDGLTRENVASHLQKYRLSLKKSEPDSKSGAAADAAEGTSAEKGQQDATGTSAAATARGEARTSGSAGNVGNGGSCSSSEPGGGEGDGGSSSSKDTRSDAAASEDAAPAAAAAAVGAVSDAAAAMQLEEQPEEQQQN